MSKINREKMFKRIKNKPTTRLKHKHNPHNVYPEKAPTSRKNLPNEIPLVPWPKLVQDG